MVAKTQPKIDDAIDVAESHVEHESTEEFT